MLFPVALWLMSESSALWLSQLQHSVATRGFSGNLSWKASMEAQSSWLKPCTSRMAVALMSAFTGGQK